MDTLHIQAYEMSPCGEDVALDLMDVQATPHWHSGDGTVHCVENLAVSPLE